MANLGNDEKSKIREEEAFRFEVQKELAVQLPKKWYLLTGRIFNSRIMVAVAFGAIGWFGGGEFLKLTDARKTQRTNDIVTEKLITEIDYRATRTEEYLGSLEQDMASSETSELGKTGSELLMQATGQANNDLRINLFGEYASDNMASLLSQLVLIFEPRSSMRKTLHAAISSTAELQSMRKILDDADVATYKLQGLRKIPGHAGAATDKLQTMQKVLDDAGATTDKLQNIRKVLGDTGATTDKLQSMQKILGDAGAATYKLQNIRKVLGDTGAAADKFQTMQETLDTAISSTAELQSMSADILSHDPGEAVAKLIIERTKRQLKSLTKVTGKSYLANGKNPN